MSHSPYNRIGLTLIEMVVVLAILAVLATVAVKSLAPIADQARYETTLKTLEQTVDAIVDDRQQASGVRQVSGFVADVGKLPETLGMIVDAEGKTTFEDVPLDAYPFVDRNGPSASSTINPTGVDCSEVSLRCGWRGPYLTVSNIANGPVDGWGRPFALGGSPVSVNWNPVTDQYTQKGIDVERLALQTVSGSIQDQFGATKIAEVVLVYPDPTLSTSTLAVKADADGADDGKYRFDDVPIGVRALVFKDIGSSNQAIRYVEVSPMQPANLPITITEF